MYMWKTFPRLDVPANSCADNPRAASQTPQASVSMFNSFMTGQLEKD